MRIREKVWTWLGINTILKDICSNANLLIKVRIEQEGQRRMLLIQEQLLGRIVANMDPLFRKSEFDPKRREQSDRLGGEIIKRLYAEQEVRDRTLPVEEGEK